MIQLPMPSLWKTAPVPRLGVPEGVGDLSTATHEYELALWNILRCKNGDMEGRGHGDLCGKMVPIPPSMSSLAKKQHLTINF